MQRLGILEIEICFLAVKPINIVSDEATKTGQSFATEEVKNYGYNRASLDACSRLFPENLTFQFLPNNLDSTATVVVSFAKDGSVKWFSSVRWVWKSRTGLYVSSVTLYEISHKKKRKGRRPETY